MAPGVCFYGGCNVKPYNANMPWAVGASNARPCKLPVTSYFWCGCPPRRMRGEVSGSRNKPTHIIAIISKRQGIIGENANFRQVCRGRIYASRAVSPVGCIARMVATGGIYAAPTNQSVMFIIIYGRGRCVFIAP